MTSNAEDQDRRDRLEASVLLQNFAKSSPGKGRRLNALLTKILRRSDARIKELETELKVAQRWGGSREPE